ncbi:MAG: hypothetical protein WCJ29_01635 [bacterium]
MQKTQAEIEVERRSRQVYDYKTDEERMNVVRSDEPTAVRVAAVSGLEDQKLLPEILFGDREVPVRIAAVDRVRGGGVLRCVVREDTDWRVRLRALQRLPESDIAEAIERDPSVEVKRSGIAELPSGHVLRLKFALETEDTVLARNSLANVFGYETTALSDEQLRLVVARSVSKVTALVALRLIRETQQVHELYSSLQAELPVWKSLSELLEVLKCAEFARQFTIEFPGITKTTAEDLENKVRTLDARIGVLSATEIADARSSLARIVIDLREVMRAADWWASGKKLGIPDSLANIFKEKAEVMTRIALLVMVAEFGRLGSLAKKEKLVAMCEFIAKSLGRTGKEKVVEDRKKSHKKMKSSIELVRDELEAQRERFDQIVGEVKLRLRL